MSTEIMPIEHLTESQNFGQWITKINEVVDAYNIAIGVTNYVNTVVKKAEIAGQVGDKLSSSTKSDYNKFLTNGVYHVGSSATNAPNTLENNLYVATDEDSVTQFVVSVESEPKFYIRCRKNTTSTFSPWYYIPSKDVNDATYLKLIGGEITGSLNVTNDLSTKNLSVSNTTKLNGDIRIEPKNNIYETLYITNDNNSTVFNAKTSSLPVAYYIQEDGSVTKDIEGKIIEYYLFDNTLITYNNVYYIQRNKNTITLDENGTKVMYYIQDDGKTITNHKNGNGVVFIVEDETNVFKIDATTQTKSFVYYILKNVWYSYNTHFFLKNNILYLDGLFEIPKYYIEGNTIVDHIVNAYLHKDKDFPNGPYVKATSDVEGLNVLYYIKDNVYYIDADYTNPVFYVVNDTICSDEEGNNIFFYIKENTLITKRLLYYVRDNIISLEEDGDALFYIADSKVISLLEKKYYIQKVLDTITTDKTGINVVYYKQPDNRLTTDFEGNITEYYLQPTTVTTDKTGQNIVYYIEDDILRTQDVKYYIQDNNQVTSDKEGLRRFYTKVGTQLLEETFPLIIDMGDNVGNVNGTAEFAQFVKPTGLTNSFLGTGLDKAASGQAIFDLYNFSRRHYMPYSGGIFTGLVVYRDDIRLDRNNGDKQTKIYSYGDLNFECLKTVSFAANNDWCELYIDRMNRQSNIDVPCVIGARTREGTTANEIGDPLYALGSVEFTEDTTTLRLRKTNLTNVENNEEKTNIALILNRTSFSPSVDRALSLGTGEMRFTTVYTTDSAISTSDRNLKTDILDIDDALLDKWKNIKWKTFKYKDSVAEKGDNARIHTGLIAQEVEDVVDVLEARKYGFYCEDSWGDVYDTQYLTFPAQYDVSGVMTRPERREKVVTLKKAAGSQLSLRYQEVQAIENAYLRRELETLRKEVEELKKFIKK